MREKMPSDNLRVHIAFKRIVYDYMERFKKEYEIDISTTEATKKIAKKIEDAGGLVV